MKKVRDEEQGSVTSCGEGLPLAVDTFVLFSSEIMGCCVHRHWPRKLQNWALLYPRWRFKESRNSSL